MYVAVVAQWRELAVIAAACLLLLALAAPFLIGRTNVEVDLGSSPSGSTAGESVAAGVLVKNIAQRPTDPHDPRGAGRLVRAPLRHRLAGSAGGRHEESFTIRTEHRGVIAVGPATTRRGDPIGIFSRDMVWTPVREVLVRPPMVPLDSLGAGLLRDLEGVSTDALSQSDLAFHALREYVPGDDLRHIHWRSSAKVMASGGESSLLVRQYLDTRRSHAAIVVDDVESSWADPEDFESAMSVAALDRRTRDAGRVRGVLRLRRHRLDRQQRTPGPRRRLSRRPRRERHREGRAPGRPRSLRTAVFCFLIGGPDAEFTDLSARRGCLPAGGTPLRDPDRSVGHQLASPRPVACRCCTSPRRTTSARSCSGACE